MYCWPGCSKKTFGNIFSYSIGLALKICCLVLLENMKMTVKALYPSSIHVYSFVTKLWEQVFLRLLFSAVSWGMSL